MTLDERASLMARAGTRGISDANAIMVRLSCGHAKIVQAESRFMIGERGSTACLECDPGGESLSGGMYEILPPRVVA